MAYSNKCRVQSASGIGIRDQRSETGDWSSRFAHIPVLLASMDHLGLAELVDERFVPHKNWDGVSLGKALSGWLTHILSEGDHRLNQVQDWAAKRAETLNSTLYINSFRAFGGIGGFWAIRCAAGAMQKGLRVPSFIVLTFLGMQDWCLWLRSIPPSRFRLESHMNKLITDRRK